MKNNILCMSRLKYSQRKVCSCVSIMRNCFQFQGNYWKDKCWKSKALKQEERNVERRECSTKNIEAEEYGKNCMEEDYVGRLLRYLQYIYTFVSISSWSSTKLYTLSIISFVIFLRTFSLLTFCTFYFDALLFRHLSFQ